MDLPRSYVKAEEARLIRRIQSLEIHRAGLDRAVEPFGGAKLDRQLWQQAFDSDDPGVVVARNGLTGCYSAVVNAYVEVLKAGAHLAGLTSHKRDHTREAIDRARDDGAITKQQAAYVHELFRFEGRVEHFSPDIRADEVREAVELLRAEASGLIEAAVIWLERHGVRIA